MLPKFLSNIKFHRFLTDLDGHLAEETRQKGCPHCGEKLNISNYPRSPFGVPTSFRVFYRQRLSLCCTSCRKRTTPPSVRFFGHRWYCSPIFMLFSTLMNKPRKNRLMALQRELDLTISKQTLWRWHHWWKSYFPASAFWKQNKALMPEQGMRGPFPWAIIHVYSGPLEKRLIQFLRFLMPITAGNLRAV